MKINTHNILLFMNHKILFVIDGNNTMVVNSFFGKFIINDIKDMTSYSIEPQIYDIYDFKVCKSEYKLKVADLADINLVCYVTSKIIDEMKIKKIIKLVNKLNSYHYTDVCIIVNNIKPDEVKDFVVSKDYKTFLFSANRFFLQTAVDNKINIMIPNPCKFKLLLTYGKEGSIIDYNLIKKPKDSGDYNNFVVWLRDYNSKFSEKRKMVLYDGLERIINGLSVERNYKDEMKLMCSIKSDVMKQFLGNETKLLDSIKLALSNSVVAEIIFQLFINHSLSDYIFDQIMTHGRSSDVMTKAFVLYYALINNKKININHWITVLSIPSLYGYGDIFHREISTIEKMHYNHYSSDKIIYEPYVRYNYKILYFFCIRKLTFVSSYKELKSDKYGYIKNSWYIHNLLNHTNTPLDIKYMIRVSCTNYKDIKVLIDNHFLKYKILKQLHPMAKVKINSLIKELESYDITITKTLVDEEKYRVDRINKTDPTYYNVQPLATPEIVIKPYSRLYKLSDYDNDKIIDEFYKLFG